MPALIRVTAVDDGFGQDEFLVGFGCLAVEQAASVAGKIQVVGALPFIIPCKRRP